MCGSFDLEVQLTDRPVPAHHNQLPPPLPPTRPEIEITVIAMTLQYCGDCETLQLFISI
jgi:hypothetical protein